MLIVETGHELCAERDSAIVCLPLLDDLAPPALIDRALATLDSVMEDGDTQCRTLLAGDTATIEALDERLGDLSGDAVMGMPVASPASAARLINAVIEATAPADLIVITPGTRVHSGWRQTLRAAAISDTAVASATPLFAGDRSAAHDIMAHSLHIYPKIAAMGPHCIYIRRPALDLLGHLDERGSLNDALTAAAEQLIALGMVHVGADDTVICPAAPATDDIGGSIDQADSKIQEVIASEHRGALQRALRRGLAATRQMSVTIDGRSLTDTVGGTQTYVLALVLAMAGVEVVRTRVLVPDDLSDRAATALQAAPDVEIIGVEEASKSEKTDIAHRPQQVFSIEDFKLLKRVGERVVLTHQDLIAYHNHSYHRDLDTWRRHRRATQLGLSTADQVIFFSEHARQDALAEDLLATDRAHVIGIGPEPLEMSSCAETRPEGVSPQDEFLLCIGADYTHKNRPFAIRLLAALRDLGWPGRLVLAGPHVPHGSSREQEQALLNSLRELAGDVVDLGAVDEQTKLWLCSHACAFLYPTVYEGFGLVPLEAAMRRTPCLFAAQTSLVELAGEAAILQPWDADASAHAVLPLLRDSPERSAHLDALTRLRAPTWSEVAEQLLAVYELAASGAAPTAPTWQELDPESYAAVERNLDYHRDLAQRYQDAYHDLEDRVRTGLPLIDRGGLLTAAQQRGLMRIAARKPLGDVALAPFGLLGHRAQPTERDGSRLRPPDRP